VSDILMLSFPETIKGSGGWVGGARQMSLTKVVLLDAHPTRSAEILSVAGEETLSY
jgi:hypothetical protein